MDFLEGKGEGKGVGKGRRKEEVERERTKRRGGKGDESSIFPTACTIVSRNDRLRQCAHVGDFKTNQKTKSRITVFAFNCASIGEEGGAA